MLYHNIMRSSIKPVSPSVTSDMYLLSHAMCTMSSDASLMSLDAYLMSLGSISCPWAGCIMCTNSRDAINSEQGFIELPRWVSESSGLWQWVFTLGRVLPFYLPPTKFSQ